jgi:hypothetical protein
METEAMAETGGFAEFYTATIARMLGSCSR